MKFMTMPSLTSRIQNFSLNCRLSEKDTVDSMNACREKTMITKLHVHVTLVTLCSRQLQAAKQLYVCICTCCIVHVPLVDLGKTLAHS